MARAGRRDAGLLYVAKALGENPKASANSIIAGLRERGIAYDSRQNILKDIAGIKGTPQKVNPGAIKGGYLSGVARSKEAKALSPDARAKLKEAASKAIDYGVDAGAGSPKKTAWTYNATTGQFSLAEELDYDDVEDLPEGAPIPDGASLASGLSRDEAYAFTAALDALYDRLGL